MHKMLTLNEFYGHTKFPIIERKLFYRNFWNLAEGDFCVSQDNSELKPGKNAFFKLMKIQEPMSISLQPTTKIFT